MRVEIPAYIDRWMRGDRYGEVISIRCGTRKRKGADAILTVKLDKSGKTIRVMANDCKEV